MKKPKICVLNPFYAPYRDPVLQEIRYRDHYNIDNYVLSEVDIAHKYNKHRYNLDNRLVKKDIIIGERCFLKSFGLVKSIIQKKYDLFVVFGHSDYLSLFFILWCYFSKKALIYSADSILTGQKKKWLRSLRNKVVKKILRIARAVWIPGAATRCYMDYLGVPSDSIFEGYYCLDAEKIMQLITSERNDVTSIRERLKISQDAYVFLMVANMTPRRQHLNLIQAFGKICLPQKICLVIVGEGSEKQKLMNLCKEISLSNIFFIGNVKFEELASYYAIANAYVHTGTEPYSTAVLYAAIVGLPIITTTLIGAGSDLSSDACKPLLIEPNDIDGLSKCMEELVLFPEESSKLGKYLQQQIQLRSVAWAADQLEKAIEFSLNVK